MLHPSEYLDAVIANLFSVEVLGGETDLVSGKVEGDVLLAVFLNLAKVGKT